MHHGWLDLETTGKWSQAKPTAIAVSGGSDSLGLMYLTKQTFPDISLYAVTVNHGLRADAQKEADHVARICDGFNIPHHTIMLDNLELGPNQQARSRVARYAAMADWAAAAGIYQIAVAHTREDIAETFLLRLARGSGLNGLSAMNDFWDQGGVRFLRPTLAVSRQDLRDMLSGAGIQWVNDPSNQDARYDRVRMRQALPDLAELGLTVDRLADAAQALRRAQGAIDAAVADLWHDAVRADDGDAIINRAIFNQAPAEVRLRLIATLVKWIGNANYAPRFAKLTHALSDTGKRTLHGVVWADQGDDLRLTREHGACDGPAQNIWDGRWAFDFIPLGHHIQALGADGLMQCPNWRDTGTPRYSLLASPSVWKGDVLVSAPFAGVGNRDTLRLIPPPGLHFTR